jgi:hypothetical protein
VYQRAGDQCRAFLPREISVQGSGAYVPCGLLSVMLVGLLTRVAIVSDGLIRLSAKERRRVFGLNVTSGAGEHQPRRAPRLRRATE